jgi:hypothetical protein
MTKKDEKPSEKLKKFTRTVLRIGRIKIGLILLACIATVVGVSQSGKLAPQTPGAGKNVTHNPLLTPTEPTISGADTTVAEQYSAEAVKPGKSGIRKGGPADLTHLIEGSELIVRGLTRSVTDGFENGVPYTEVTIQVKDALRGEFDKEYTFRQFGLIAPKKVNGKMFLAATPEGWSRYAVGEDVLLFLYPRASKTGLRTTAGLGQGKIKIESGNARSALNNDRLFDGVEVNAQLDEAEDRLVASKGGAVNSESLISFVRRAVKENWIERRVMRNAKK